MKWDIPVITEEGAYLYGYAFSPSSFITVVGTDDAVLSVFKIEPKANDARFGASGP
jgi:hypothetical protein